MPDPNDKDLDRLKILAKEDVRELLIPAMHKIVDFFDCAILADVACLEECSVAARESLSKLPNIRNPNQFKRAGHYAYWVRKLKPLCAVNPGAVVRLADLYGIKYNAHTIPPERPKNNGATMYLNLTE